MSADLLPCVEIEPERRARHSVIWLHGLGADGHDFEPIVPYLGLDPALDVRFVFPNAPKIGVTINMGLIMPAWYDVRGIDLKRDEDVAGIKRSAGHVRRLIERENERGVPDERVLLAGFSQGAAVAMYVALRHPQRLAGLLALSTYMVCEGSVEAEISDANRGLPVFQAHGTFDPMVAPERGEAAHRRLVELGYDATWKTYPIQHQVSPDEIQEIGVWLNGRFKDSG